MPCCTTAHSPISVKKKSSGDLVRLSNEVARRGRSRERVTGRLREAVLEGLPVAYRAAEVREALEAGKVNRLLLLNSFALPQMICKKCHFGHHKKEICPTCGGQMQAPNLEELHQQADN